MKKFRINPQIERSHNGFRDQVICIMSIQDKSSQLSSGPLTLRIGELIKLKAIVFFLYTLEKAKKTIFFKNILYIFYMLERMQRGYKLYNVNIWFGCIY